MTAGGSLVPAGLGVGVWLRSPACRPQSQVWSLPVGPGVARSPHPREARVAAVTPITPRSARKQRLLPDVVGGGGPSADRRAVPPPAAGPRSPGGEGCGTGHLLQPLPRSVTRAPQSVKGVLFFGDLLVFSDLTLEVFGQTQNWEGVSFTSSSHPQRLSSRSLVSFCFSLWTILKQITDTPSRPPRLHWHGRHAAESLGVPP